MRKVVKEKKTKITEGSHMRNEKRKNNHGNQQRNEHPKIEKGKTKARMIEKAKG